MSHQIKFLEIDNWIQNELSSKVRLIVPEVIDSRVLTKLYHCRNSKEVIHSISEKTRLQCPVGTPASEITRRVQSCRTRMNKFIKCLQTESTPYKGSPNFITFRASYIQSPGFGRMMAENSKSIFMMTRPVRASLITGIYDDIDIVNAHPKFLLNYIKLYPKDLSQNNYLSEYVNDREPILKKCNELLNWPRETAKMQFLRMMNGGGNDNEMKEYGLYYPFVEGYYNSMKLTILEMEKLSRHTDFKDKHFDKAVAKDKYNKDGTICNRFLLLIENKILNIMVQEMIKKGAIMGPLCYDGILVQKPYLEDQGIFSQVQTLTETDLREIEVIVEERTQFPISLTYKSIPEGLNLEMKYESKKIPTEQVLAEEFVDLVIDSQNMFRVDEQVIYYSELSKLWTTTKNILEVGAYASKVLQSHYREALDDEEAITLYMDSLQSVSKMRNIGTLVIIDEKLKRDVSFLQRMNRVAENYLPIKDGLVINLRTLEVSDRKKDHFFTFEIQRGYIPNSRNNDKIEKIVSEYMEYKNTTGEVVLDVDQFDSFKKSIGYSLTASVEQKLFFLVQGQTNTGKSTFFTHIIRAGLYSKELCTSISPVLICDEKKGGIQDEHQCLELGARLVYCSEFEDSMRISKTGLKRLTGDDHISFRPMKAVTREYKCAAKIWLHTNEIPRMDMMDDALTGRFTTFLFRGDFSKPTVSQSKNLKWIKEHTDEVFSYLCGLSCLYFKEGSQIPVSETMLRLKTEIMRKMDPLLEFSETYYKTYTLREVNKLTNSEIKKELFQKLATFTMLWQDYMTFCNSRGYKNRMSLEIFKNRIGVTFPVKIKKDIVHKAERIRILYCYQKYEDKETGFSNEMNENIFES